MFYNGKKHILKDDDSFVHYVEGLFFNDSMPNASTISTFVYLSNLESISFEQAYKAAGFSSNMDDYFPVEDAVLVEWTLK